MKTSILKIRIRDNIDIEIVLILILVFSILMSALYKVSLVRSGIVFALFIILGLLLPGFALTKLLRVKVRNEIELFTYSFFLGYIITLIEYFVVVPFGLQQYAWTISLFITIISVLFVFCFYRKKSFNMGKRDVFGIAVCIFFALLMIAIEVFTYAGKNLLPPGIKENELYNDCLYWIGNTIELMKEYPPKNFRDYPKTYKYHYFTSCQLAFICLTTGIKPTLLSFGYSFLQPIIMIVTGGYCLYSRMTDKRILRIFSLFALIFTSGDQAFSQVTYTHHMFIGQFAFDYGMGFFLFFIFLVIKEYDNLDTEICDCFILLLVFSTLCGVKASFAAIAVAGIGLICIRWLMLQRWKKAFIIGIPVLITFIILYLSVTNVVGYAGDIISGFSKPRVWEMHDDARIVRENLHKFPIPWLLSEILFFLLYTISCNPLIFLLIGYEILQRIKDKRKLQSGSIELIILILLCSYINVYIGMIGLSQMYFMMTAYPLGILFIVRNWNEKFGIISKTIIIILLIIGFYSWFHLYNGKVIFDYISDGYRNYFINSIEYSPSGMTYISEKQMEAYTWLDERAGEQDIVTSNDKRLQLGVFTQCYVVNSEDTKKLFSQKSLEEERESIESIKKRGVSWIVYVKNEEFPSFVIDTDICKQMFKNEEVTIYKII